MEIIREKLVLPNGGKKLLLHSCCAPCSGEVMEAISASGIEFTIFFYNPNIHPKKEYEIRKNENIRFAEQLGIPIIDADYDVDNWYERAKGMEYEPERGKRCTMCFDMRFERTALYAYENGFDTITSSLGISRWKNFDQINDSGLRAVAPYEGIIGHITGEKKVVLHVCWKLVSENTSICRNIVVVLILSVIPTNGD